MALLLALEGLTVAEEFARPLSLISSWIGFLSSHLL